MYYFKITERATNKVSESKHTDVREMLDAFNTLANIDLSEFFTKIELYSEKDNLPKRIHFYK